jgi:hypothetical protein
MFRSMLLFVLHFSDVTCGLQLLCESPGGKWYHSWQRHYVISRKVAFAKLDVSEYYQFT